MCLRLGFQPVQYFSDVLENSDTDRQFYMRIAVVIASAQKLFRSSLFKSIKSFMIYMILHCLSETELCSDV